MEIEKEGLLAHAAVRALQLLLALLELVALRLDDDEVARADIGGLVQIRGGLFGHGVSSLQKSI